MTISSQMNTNKLTFYSLAQPLLQDDKFAWLDLGGNEFKVNSVSQLMIIEKNPFILSHEEEDIITTILANEYGVYFSLFQDKYCSFETILQPPHAPHFFETSQFLHKLLPHEIHSPNFSKLSMLEKISKGEFSLGKELNVSKSFSLTHQKIILKLLKENQ